MYMLPRYGQGREWTESSGGNRDRGGRDRLEDDGQVGEDGYDGIDQIDGDGYGEMDGQIEGIREEMGRCRERLEGDREVRERIEILEGERRGLVEGVDRLHRERGGVGVGKRVRAEMRAERDRLDRERIDTVKARGEVDRVRAMVVEVRAGVDRYTGERDRLVGERERLMEGIQGGGVGREGRERLEGIVCRLGGEDREGQVLTATLRGLVGERDRLKGMVEKMEGECREYTRGGGLIESGGKGMEERIEGMVRERREREGMVKRLREERDRLVREIESIPRVDIQGIMGVERVDRVDMPRGVDRLKREIEDAREEGDRLRKERKEMLDTIDRLKRRQTEVREELEREWREWGKAQRKLQAEQTPSSAPTDPLAALKLKIARQEILHKTSLDPKPKKGISLFHPRQPSHPSR